MPSPSKKRRAAVADMEDGSSPLQKRARPTIEIPTALDIGRKFRRANPKASPPPKPKNFKRKKNSASKPAAAEAPRGKGKHASSSDPAIACNLDNAEARLWSQPHAAKCASHFHNPGRKVRLVGVISRTVHVKNENEKNKTNKKKNTNSIDPFSCLEWNDLGQEPEPFELERNVQRTFQPPTVPQAKTEILREHPETPEGKLLLEANQLVNEWKKTIHEPYTPGWDERGELLDCPVEGALRVSKVLQLLQDDILTDNEPNMTRSYYHGMRKIAIDTKSVLTALSRFGVPEELLYGQPLVVSYVMAEMQKVDAHCKTYQLKIPVYVHRVAFEIMSLYDAHTIWCALDEDSYNVVRPLSIPPRAEERVFFSAETPRVVMDSEEDDDDDHDHDDSGESLEEDEGDDSDGNDVLLQTSTRRSDVISAYSFPGLLKLLESPGCDVSAWAGIEAKLKGKLQVELLPHQIHGICWMMQQEHIEGGLNALLWEERQFADGHGSYFFSPAVGQLRLTLGATKKHSNKNPPSVGGLLVDEMGLGKTIQVLALILATLDDGNDDPTLIVVPPALLSQWRAETKKVTGNHLRTCVFDTESLAFVYGSGEKVNDGKVHLVFTTYAALSRPIAARVLKSYSWKRIVLDEMQEIRSSTTVLAQNCQGLRGRRRWMVSGTPLFESIEDFKGELNFLGLEPFSAENEDGFFQFCIKQHWEAESHYGLDALRALSLVMLRRSKTMTYLDPISKMHLPLLGLPALTVRMEPVPQIPSERAIYCFLEYLVHSNLGDTDDDDEEKNAKTRNRDEGKRRLFLKLLRDACVSGHMLTGGLGCSSRLDTLDRVMVEHHRKTPIEEGAASSGVSRDSTVLSVEKAIEFLSRVIDSARVEDGFETTQLVGGGMGRSRRDRAFESADVKLGEAKQRLKEAKNEANSTISRRAKARWHLALELITTGALKTGEIQSVNLSVRNLWRWRRVVIDTLQLSNKSETDFPSWLYRGWRPSTNFFRSESFYRARDNWRKLLLMVVGGEAFRTGLSSTEQRLKENVLTSNAEDSLSGDDSTAKGRVQPLVSEATRKCHARWRWRYVLKRTVKRRNDFADFNLPEEDDQALSFLRLSKRYRWAHPCTALFENIPLESTEEHVRKSIASVLNSRDAKASQLLAFSPVYKDTVSWKAYIQFQNDKQFKQFFGLVSKKEGVALSHRPLSWINEESQAAAEALKDATAAHKVYPCDTNIKKFHEAKTAHKLALLGLRMHTATKRRERHVVVRRAFEHMRSDVSLSSWSLVERCLTAVDGCNEDLSRQKMVLSTQKRMVDRLEKVTKQQVSSEVQNLSTFEVFEALKSGQAELTSCPVCLCPLGDGCDGQVSLTRCGHVFCKDCLRGYFDTKENEGNLSPSCIACRKQIRRLDSVVVDPKICDEDDVEKKRDEARSLVRKASEMLEQSNGLLEPYLWEALYLSFDLPKNVSKSRHATFTAIPGQLLAHFRHTTGLPLNERSKRKDAEKPASLVLSSKIRRLLDDLPKNERSVVFATCSTSVKHVVHILDEKDFHVNCLFTGQNESDSRKALDDWRSAREGVLVVQSGAAACGLTLTDSCKMFLVEPFLRFEEEQQAYSRLHRYGQTKNVQCIVYYAPVSIESRLLEWRKKEKSSESPDEEVIFSKMKFEDEESDFDDEDVTQSRFLLGLDQPSNVENMAE